MSFVFRADAGLIVFRLCWECGCLHLAEAEYRLTVAVRKTVGHGLYVSCLLVIKYAYKVFYTYIYMSFILFLISVIISSCMSSGRQASLFTHPNIAAPPK